jgi:hypothetical protein
MAKPIYIITLNLFFLTTKQIVHNHNNQKDKKLIFSVSKTNPKLKIYHFLSFNVVKIFINRVKKIETLCFLYEIQETREKS